MPYASFSDALDAMHDCAKRSLAAYDAIEPKADAIEKGLSEAVKARNLDALQDWVGRAKQTAQRMQAEVVDVAAPGVGIYLKMDTMIQGAPPTPPEMAKLDARLKQLQNHQKWALDQIARIKAQFAAAATQAKALQKAAKANQARRVEVEAELKTLASDLRNAAEKVVRLVARADECFGAARSAAERRDAAALAAARKQFDAAWSALDPAWRDADSRLQAFPAGLKSPLTSKQIAALTTRVEELAKPWRAATQAHDAAQRAQGQIGALKLAEADGRKAAAVLEIDRKHEQALAAALTGDDGKVRSQLKQLAAKLKTRLSADDMFKRLRGAQLV